MAPSPDEKSVAAPAPLAQKMATNGAGVSISMPILNDKSGGELERTRSYDGAVSQPATAEEGRSERRGRRGNREEEMHLLHLDGQRSSAATARTMSMRADRFINDPFYRNLLSAIQAGSYITFGGALATFLSIGIESEGAQNFMVGIGFMCGFSMAIFSHSALFTEINVIMPMHLVDLRHSIRRCLRFWATTFFGNILGALLVGIMLRGSQVYGPTQTARLQQILNVKLAQEVNGVGGWFSIVLSGVLGNWLVGSAAWFACSATYLTGKFVGLALPVLAFVVLGVQHSPANMGFFSMGLCQGDILIRGEPLGWWQSLAWNILPAALGNIIGGSVFVALLMYAIHIQRHNVEYVPTYVTREGVKVGKPPS